MTFYQIALYPPQQPQQKPSPWWQSLIWKEREREGGRHCHCQPDIEGGKSVLKLESKKYGWPWNEMRACDQQNNLHSWYIFNTCQSKPLLSLFSRVAGCVISLKREWGGFAWSGIKQSPPWKEASPAQSKDLVFGKATFYFYKIIKLLLV